MKTYGLRSLGRISLGLGLGLFVTFWTGCADNSPSPPPDVPVEIPSPPVTEPGELSDQAGAGQEEPSATLDVAPDPPDEGSQVIADPLALPKSEVVMLGSPDLTAGIPGEGPLLGPEVEEWLGRPENHVPLEVKLPLGLDAGITQVKGLQENPLTRAKIELGRQLYFDKRLSANHTVSCATCHDPAEGFARHTQFGVGIDGQTGNRNSPVSYNRILSDNQFWDGRAESLEEQAVGPIANRIEMGNTLDQAVATLKGIPGYQKQFSIIFAEEEITIENVGRAIASFERAIVTSPSPFDYYERLRKFQEAFADDLEDLDAFREDEPEAYEQYVQFKEQSDEHSISESAVRGRDLFFSDRVGCTACHVGPNLTDEKYHNLGVGMDKENPDVGRSQISSNDKERGAFKTPTIRNVALSAPYMHDGSQKTLQEVVEWYNKGGHANSHLSDKIKKLKLTDQEEQDLVAFMHACTGAFPEIETGRLPE